MILENVKIEIFDDMPTDNWSITEHTDGVYLDVYPKDVKGCYISIKVSTSDYIIDREQLIEKYSEYVK